MYQNMDENIQEENKDISEQSNEDEENENSYKMKKMKVLMN